MVAVNVQRIKSGFLLIKLWFLLKIIFPIQSIEHAKWPKYYAPYKENIVFSQSVPFFVTSLNGHCHYISNKYPEPIRQWAVQYKIQFVWSPNSHPTSHRTKLHFSNFHARFHQQIGNLNLLKSKWVTPKRLEYFDSLIINLLLFFSFAKVATLCLF